MDATEILSRDEVFRVLESFEPYRTMAERGIMKPHKWTNLVLFRLSACCGLRVKEICELNMDDIHPLGPMPVLRIRAAATKRTLGKGTKRGRGRTVHLDWDSGTLSDLQVWYRYRVHCGAGPDAAYLPTVAGGRLIRHTAAERWWTAIKALGPERVDQLSVHCGRHTAISHWLAAGRDLVAVRDQAGHGNITTTNIYLHYVHTARGEKLPDVFAR
jgi:integrase